ncbi:MAG: hypothetical protein P8075_19085 [Deltaproteobacteria bacterium]|jgi:hypothetical protein
MAAGRNGDWEPYNATRGHGDPPPRLTAEPMAARHGDAVRKTEVGGRRAEERISDLGFGM